MKLFDKVAVFGPRKNKFDLSHERKFSFNMGFLTPILIQDIVPGDKFRVNTELLIRFAPMLAPMMHRVNVFTHYFFVPNRLIWDEWEDFITGGEDGQAAPVAPFMLFDESTRFGIEKGTLSDYLGVPVPPAGAIVNPIKVSSLPYRAYQLIYNEYFRDQNLTAEVAINKASGQDAGGNMNQLITTRKRAWEKDYFTSALPWSQRGGNVMLPIDPQINYSNPATVLTGGVGAFAGPLNTDATSQVTANSVAGQQPAEIRNIDSITNATTTINDLRKAVRLQEWLEKMARGGSRYVEQMKVMFGVSSSDARLQRPEFLGGGRTPVVISEVLSNFQQVGGTIPQGNMSGHGISVGNQNGFKRFFEEHGFVIGIMSVLPKTAYQQGLHRMFTRENKFDYFWNDFAQIGEQEVKQREIFHDYLTASQGNATFGYQSRYCEYKYKESSVHGDFRDNLSYWHMGRIFATDPGLNTSFVESDPTQRIFAVTDPDEHKMYCQLYHGIDAIRPMPYFGTPTL